MTIYYPDLVQILAENALAEIACIGGAVDALTEIATTITEQKQILTTRHIQTNRREQRGATGINRENRHIGVGVEYYTRKITVSTFRNIKAAP
ncbi:MAG: hypothetical protein KHY93_07595 [Clostridiales bacterium]|nr:hypothetical protein [Clostridiales bacterium]